MKYTLIVFTLLAYSCNTKTAKNMQASVILNQLICTFEKELGHKNPGKTSSPDENESKNEVNDLQETNNTNIYDNLKYNATPLIDGDIIIMKDKLNNEIVHATIYNTSSKESGNIIGSILSGVRFCDLDIFLKRNNCSYKAYRYNPDNKKENEIIKIRKNISEQARLWYYKLTEYTNRNFYRHEDFFFYLNLKHNKTNIKNDLLLYNSFKNSSYLEDLNALLYLKYSLRQNTLPSLNKGFVCAGFVISCVGNALINDITLPYSIKDQNYFTENSDQKLWPSLKYPKSNLSSSPYTNAVELLRQKRPTKYTALKYKKFLSIEHPDLNIKKIEPYLVPINKIILNKISIESYLKLKDTTEEILREEIKKRIGNLIRLNIRISTLEDLNEYLTSNYSIWKTVNNDLT